jgi:hypothetical protein
VKNLQIEVREEFVGFLYAKSTRGQVLATLLLNTMDEYEVDGDKLRAQGYDGAANMSGKHQGVQAHVRPGPTCLAQSMQFPAAVKCISCIVIVG